MKREILIATSVAALLLTGCFNSETGASQRAANEASESHAPAKHEAKAEKAAPAHEAKAAEPVAQEKAAAPAPVAEEKTEAPAEATPAAEAPKEEATAAATPAAEVNTAACAGCHGASFEKKAMGKSKIVKDMSKADIATALHGYKDGSYGGDMKALMKGQVAGLDDASIEAIANKIGQ